MNACNFNLTSIPNSNRESNPYQSRWSRLFQLSNAYMACHLPTQKEDGSIIITIYCLWCALFPWENLERKKREYISVRKEQLTISYNRKDLQIPTGTYKMIHVNSFAYSSVKVWNSILPDVRNCNSLSSFKAGYLKHHFNGF